MDVLTAHPANGLDNSLAASRPDLAAEWDHLRNGGVRPEQISTGSRQRAWWRCAADARHRWRTFVCHRTTNASGCPFCSPRYGGPEVPALTYFVRHGGHRAHKVGIATRSGDRLQQYLRGGWTEVAICPFDRLADARLFEYEVLRAWDLAGPFRHLGIEHLPRNGASETAVRLTRDVTTATRLAFRLSAATGLVVTEPLHWLAAEDARLATLAAEAIELG